MTDDYTPAPQSIIIAPSPRHMERPIEVVVTEHLNDRHSNATKVYLTYGEAAALVDALQRHLETTKGVSYE